MSGKKTCIQVLMLSLPDTKIRIVTLLVTTNLERSNLATHNEIITTSDPSHTSCFISVFKTRKNKVGKRILLLYMSAKFGFSPLRKQQHR